MSKRQSPIIGIIPHIFLWLCLGTGIWLFFGHFSKQKEFEKPDITENQFGGQDWVNWQDREDRIKAVSVHPLIRNNPDLGSNYLQKDDILLKIDYQPVYTATDVRTITYSSPPGKVFIYQIQRDDPQSFKPQVLNLFVINNYVPRYIFQKDGWFWSLHVWILAIGAFLSLIVMLVVFPLLVKDLRQNLAVLAVLVLVMMVFLWQLVRFLFLLAEPELSQIGFEKVFLGLFSLILVLYSVAYFFSRATGKLKWLSLLSLILGLGLSWLNLQKLNSGQFYLYAPILSLAHLFFFSAHVTAGLLGSILENWKGRSGRDKLFHLGGLILAVFALGLNAKYLLDDLLPALDPQGPLAVATLCFFIPLINVAASELKFGKVSVVLTQTILNLLAAVAVIFLYFAIHQAMKLGGVESRYQNFLEISILVLIVLVFRGVYNNYKDFFKNYFVTSQQKKTDQLNQFISRISQYSSSEKLVDDLHDQLKDFFQTDEIWVLQNDESLPGITSLNWEDLKALQPLMKENNSFWSRNKQLSSLEVPDELQSRLLSTGLNQIYPLNINEDRSGIILLGKRKSGVYNLEDVEIMSRIVQQTRLTLNVLDLVEREKLLMRETYEANLTALRSQINPHFLFNTLNTISALIHDAPDDAEDAIEKLAFIFRYTLKRSAENFVSLKDEMSLVSTYLDIEQMRFGERLEVVYEIDEEARDCMIPAIVIQTIVENSIKHGVAKIIGKGIVRLSFKVSDGFLLGEIEDNGPGIDVSKIHTSTGLTNITTRLEEIYHMKNLLYFKNTGNGTLVSIKIPIETHE